MANGNMKAERKPVTVTPSSGWSRQYNGLKEISGIVTGTIRLSTSNTLSARTWVAAATVDIFPEENVEIPWADATNGNYGGLVQITTAGAIRVYPVEAHSSSTSVAATVAYPVN